VKFTVPEVTGEPLLVTFAVSVVVLFGLVVQVGFLDELMLVVLGAATAITNFNEKLLIETLSPSESIRYRLQVPAAVAPPKTLARVVVALPWGAGRLLGVTGPGDG
jgi:hypothetical protein